jgi:hypothetical protein
LPLDNAALDTEFQGCADAMKKQGKPTVTHKPDNVVVITNFPPVCAQEAKAFKATGNTNIIVSGNEIIVKNAPAEVIDHLDG